MKEIQGKSTSVRVSEVERFHMTSQTAKQSCGSWTIFLCWRIFWSYEFAAFLATWVKTPYRHQFWRRRDDCHWKKCLRGQLKWPPNRAWRGKIDQRDSIGTTLFGCNYDKNDTPTVSRVFTDSFVHTAISSKVVGEKCVRDNLER